MQRLAQGQHPVEIDLRGREGAVELRLASESQAGSAPELDRPFVRPVLKFDLLQHGGGAVSLDVAGDAPRFDDHRAGARGRAANGARQLNGAFEARQAILHPNRDVGFRGDRLANRIDREPHLGAAVIGDAAGGDAIRITLAGDDEGALAFDRPR